MKKVIRLTESDLHRIVKNSVKRILKEEYNVDAVKARYSDKDNVDGIRGIMAVLNNWYHYATLHANGTNTKKYNPSVITQYRNGIKEYLNKINDENIKNEVVNCLNSLLSTTRNDFSNTASIIEQIASQLNEIYNKAKEGYNSKYTEERY